MARKLYTIEILQGCGDWMDSYKRYYAAQATAAAQDITARHFTAVRILRDGIVIAHSLPAFPEVAYPGVWGMRAREILAPFMAAETVTHLDPFMAGSGLPTWPADTIASVDAKIDAMNAAEPEVWLVIDSHTKAIVGACKTRKAASRSCDRRDMTYGAIRYTYRRAGAQA